MSVVRDIVKWADFFVDLKRTFESIRANSKDQEKDIEELGRQNLLLIERLNSQRREIESLERRVVTLEGNLMLSGAVIRPTERRVDGHILAITSQVTNQDGG